MEEIKLEEQPIVKPKEYLFNTWIKGNEIIETEKGGVTVLELLIDFRSHLLQNIEHNKKAYHQSKVKELKEKIKKLTIPVVSITEGKLCEICGCNDATTITEHCQTCDEYIINGDHN